jgi:hypothetical protein
MTNEEIFDRGAALRKLGRRLDRSRGGDEPRRNYDAVAAVARSLIDNARAGIPKLKPVHFDFVWDGRVNAFAFREGDTYFIGLTSGALVALQIVFYRILSDARHLPDIGDPNLERSDLSVLTALSPDAEAMYQAGMRPQLPQTEPRRAFARALFEQAFMFLVGHELAHITRGHVDYLDAKCGTPFIAEVGWTNTKAPGLMERQAIEMDADRRSTWSRIDSLRLTMAAGIPFPWTDRAPSAVELIHDWALSTGWLFRLFGDQKFAGVDLSTIPYPPVPLRRAMAFNTGLLAVRWIWDAALLPTATAAVQQANLETELTFTAITGEPTSVEGLSDAFGQLGKEHALRLWDYWNKNVADRVAPYSLEPDPPQTAPTGPDAVGFI